MRILQVMAGALQGGAEVAFVDTCIALSRTGIALEAVIRPHDLRRASLERAGIRVHTLSFGGALDFWTPHRLRGIIRSFHPTVVQTWMSRATEKTPPWSSSAGVSQYAILGRLGGYYNLKYYKHADFFLANTPDIRQYLIEKGVSSERVRHINNFADFEEESVPVNRSDFETPPDAPLLLALGRLHPSKAFDTLIRAVERVPEAYLWIAGEGPERPALEALVASLGLQKRVKLLGWREDRGALFRAADLCVFPSRYEAFGNVFAQAWAHKTPLITTDSTGPKQFVRHEEDALLTPIDDVEALKTAIQRLISDRDMANKLAERGYRRFTEEFSKDKTIAAYLAYYKFIQDSFISGPLLHKRA